MKFFNYSIYRHGFFYAILGLVCFTVTLTQAAGIRCELVADSCLDMSNATGPTITVPANTTRIDKKGLELCIPPLINSKAVDLIFTIDQSGTMDGMDPLFLTPPATRAALDLLNQYAPQSNVGYFGFENGVCDGTGTHIGHNGAGPREANPPDTRVLPAPLNQGTQLADIREQMSYNATDYAFSCGNASSGGTNYFRAFVLATDWLKQLDTPNPKIIFFLTDGLQSEQGADFDALVAASDSTNYPTVHAIFVGLGTNLALETLVQKTGGLYSQIEDFSSIKEVMLEMMGQVIIKIDPNQTTVTKDINSVWQTTTHTPTGGINRYMPVLDRDLALGLGLNTFGVVTGTNMGQSQSAINIQVSGPAETTTGIKDIPGSNLFDLACYDASALIPMEKNYTAAIEQLGAYNETGFGIALVTPADDIQAIANVKGVMDVENVKLDSVMAGYRNVAPFSRTNLKTPNNNIVEGLVGETLLLSWVHPHDPRDTASAVLPIYDNRADTTIILFQDLQGNPITEINDLGDKKFKLVVIDNKALKPFSVQLATTHGDALAVEVQPVAPKTFEAIVIWDFTTAVNPANPILEGLFDPKSADNKTIVMAKVKKAEKGLLLRKIYVPVEKAWIIDKNEDGSADMVYVRFIQNIHALPKHISDIRWPSNNTIPGKRAPAAAATPAVNPLSFVGNDNSLVLADLSQDPFAFGATSASTTSPPTLTLPDGRKPEIQDSVKPALIAIVKKPSNFSRYINKHTGVIMRYPDTLELTLSEPIVPIVGVAEPWKSLLVIEKGGAPVPIELLGQPLSLSPDGLEWQVTIDNNPGAQIVMVGDEISLNPDGPYRDLKTNKPSRRKAVVTGTDGEKNGFVSTWRGGEVAGDQNMATSFQSDMIIPIIDPVTNKVEGGIPASEVQEWVPPVGLHRGTVDINSQRNPSCVDNNTQLVLFPSDCLASRLVLTGPTDGKYVAQVMIYDNVGVFVRYLEQAFGFCGELANSARVSQSGLIMNDIVWDMKNSEGEFVGNGVYIWIIKLKFASGIVKERFYKMGVAKKDVFLHNACVSNL